MLDAATHLANLVAPGDLVEIRAFASDGTRKWGGFFDDLSACAEAVSAYESCCSGVYWGLNRPTPDILERCHNTMVKGLSGVKDVEIIRRRWILVDIEAMPLDAQAKDKRTRNASAEELGAAIEGARKIEQWMAGQTGATPLQILSGNGVHLLYKVDLANTEEVTAQVKGLLQELARRFNGRGLSIDTTVTNSSRISRLPGSWNRKFPEEPDHPWRRVEFLSEDVGGLVEPDWLAQWAPVVAPAPVLPPRQADRGSAFDRARMWIAKSDPAIMGQGGDAHTFWVVANMVNDFGLSDEDALEVMAEWNSSCQPPWSERELRAKIRSARKRAGHTNGRALEVPLRKELNGKSNGVSTGLLTPGQALVAAVKRLLDQADPWEGTSQDLWDIIQIGSNSKALGRVLSTYQNELSFNGIFVAREIRGPEKARVRMLTVTRQRQENLFRLDQPLDQDAADQDCWSDDQESRNISLDQDAADQERWSADQESQKISLDQDTADQESCPADQESRKVSLDQDTADQESCPADQESRNISLDQDSADQEKYSADQENTVKVPPPTVKDKSNHKLPKPHHFPRTDLGNAEYLLARYGHNLRWCDAANKWYVWLGSHWKQDSYGRARSLANRVARDRQSNSHSLPDQEQARDEWKWGKACEAVTRRNATLAQAMAFPKYAIQYEDLDRDLWVLNCPNGTIELRTGKLRPHNQDDMISKCTGVNFDPNATCPTWERCILECMNGQQDMVDYLQLALGYTLTGDTRETCMMISWGEGRNGKTLFHETVAAVLGTYAGTARPETFMAKQQNNGPTPDVAALRGARFISCSESNQGSRLDEALVKQVTGGDKLTACFKFQDNFTFKPECKVWFLSNHKPIIRGAELGIWRRIRLIPWEVTFTDVTADKKMADTLAEEYPGILAWMVRGCLRWQKEELTSPASMIEAASEYQREMDTLQQFIEQDCIVGPAWQEPAEHLYRGFRRWCQKSGEWIPSQRIFSSRLKSKGYKHYKSNLIFYLGIKLRTPVEEGGIGKHSDVTPDVQKELDNFPF